jgi:hypothetical protein
MNENGQELVEPIHRETVEHYEEQKQKGRELVEAMFREALEREQEQKKQQQLLVEQVHREAIEQGRVQPSVPNESATIHHTELPGARPDSPLFQEWTFYRREVGRLLAAGQAGRWLLIKGEEIIGIWDTHDEARAVALQKYLMQPCLIHQILERERVLRGPTRFFRCPG